MVRMVYAAIIELETFTQLRFIRVSPSSDQLKIRFVISDSGGCNAWVGRRAPQNEVNLREAWCWQATVIHEIAHAVGVDHEHVR